MEPNPQKKAWSFYINHFAQSHLPPEISTVAKKIRTTDRIHRDDFQNFVCWEGLIKKIDNASNSRNYFSINQVASWESSNSESRRSGQSAFYIAYVVGRALMCTMMRR